MPDYTDYSGDSTYWTLRKRGTWYLVVRLATGTYEEVERLGWYRRAGAAATAVGLLSYRKGLIDGEAMIRAAVQQKLAEIGLVVPPPDAGPDEDPGGGEAFDED